MLKTIWFQAHWLLGITAGLVLAVVGVTGGMLSFEDDLLRLVNRGVMTVEPRATPPLPPDALLERLRAAHPGRAIQSLAVAADPRTAARVGFAPAADAGAAQGGGPGGRPRVETRYVDPYTGDLLGEPRGREFFRFTMQVHRWLAAGDVGKYVVGVSTIALVVLCLSGLYLRWPRRAWDWRAWLKLDLAHKGRSLLWNLHAVLGTWALLLYLLAGLTGLYWSFEWYRSALFWITDTPRPAARQAGPPSQPAAGGQAARRPGPTEGRAAAPAGAPDIAALWAVFLRESGGYSTATLRLPQGPGQPLQIAYLPPDPPHERAGNTLVLDAATGAVREHRRYAELPFGQQIMGSMLPLHSGSYFGTVGLVLMMIASLGMPVFAVTGWMLYLDRRGKKRAARAASRAAAGGGNGRNGGGGNGGDGAGAGTLIAFASQSGTAERLAWQSAAALRAAGQPVAVERLAGLDGARLARAGRALFVVSTFGDGEPPDGARGFARRVLGGTVPLGGLEYGVLALGDRQYPRFCGFGHALDSWLRHQGARPLFDMVEADAADPGALRHWQHHLGALAGATVLPDWTPPAYERWRLVARRLLNPGSAGGPCFHLELAPADGAAASWTAGDIAEIGPRHAPEWVDGFLDATRLDGRAPVRVNGHDEPLAALLARSILPDPAAVNGAAPAALARTLRQLPHREYSIASLPEDGRVHLLVRQARHEDGRLGLGSGWLTAHAPLGAEVALRIRRNEAFHPPADDRPMLLIGNGTGLAGLRAHLKVRARRGHGRNWLIFGERNAAHDFHYRDEIAAWQAQGMVARLDLAFSRDQNARVYVQDRLRAAGAEARAWIEAGAAVYVCGSLAGMAPAVEATLADIVGAAALERMAAEGRYRRDVY